MKKKAAITDYPFTVRHLSPEDGGGYLIEYPDLPGCISDGETQEEAIKNGQDAVACWITAAKETGRSIPKPGELESQSGKWVQRVPKSMHLRLAEEAKAEGVSLNTLVISLLSEGIGRKQSNGRSHQIVSARKGKTSRKVSKTPPRRCA